MSGDHRQGHQPRACYAYLKIYVSDLSQIHGSFVLRPPPPRAGRRPRRMRGCSVRGSPPQMHNERPFSRSTQIDPTDRLAGGAAKPFTGMKPWGAGGHLHHVGQQGGRVSP
jgi:hypothetical protein